MRLFILLASSVILAMSSPAFAKGGGKGGGKARSAVSGKYVTKGYATKNPRTTVVERR